MVTLTSLVKIATVSTLFSKHINTTHYNNMLIKSQDEHLPMRIRIKTTHLPQQNICRQFLLLRMTNWTQHVCVFKVAECFEYKFHHAGYLFICLRQFTSTIILLGLLLRNFYYTSNGINRFLCKCKDSFEELFDAENAETTLCCAIRKHTSILHNKIVISESSIFFHCYQRFLMNCYK